MSNNNKESHTAQMIREEVEAAGFDDWRLWKLHQATQAIATKDAELTTLRTERDRLAGALKPFADAWHPADAAQDGRSIWYHPAAMEITLGHLRVAREAVAAFDSRDDGAPGEITPDIATGEHLDQWGLICGVRPRDNGESDAEFRKRIMGQITPAASPHSTHQEPAHE